MSLPKGIFTNAKVIVNAAGDVTTVQSGKRTPTQLAAGISQPSRTTGTIYQNTTGSVLYVSGYLTANAGGSVGQIVCQVGPTSPPATTAWANEFTATLAGSPAGFAFVVPPDYFYQVQRSGDIVAAGLVWNETALSLA